MNSPLTRRKVLITGATRGIGQAIANELAPAHDLIIGGRTPEAVEEACQKYPSAAPFIADLTDAQATENAINGLDGLDAVVHCAGALYRGQTDAFLRDDWTKAFAINVTATAELTRLLLPQLRQTQGDIVFMNSGSGIYTYPEGSVYCASKHALTAYADVLREEERPHGIRVTSIHPGHVATGMQIQLRQQTGQPYEPHLYVQPETIASAVKFALDAGTSATVETMIIRPRWPISS